MTWALVCLTRGHLTSVTLYLNHVQSNTEAPWEKNS